MQCDASASYLTAGNHIFEPLLLKRETSVIYFIYCYYFSSEKKGLDHSAFT